jgi:hypothetical protein
MTAALCHALPPSLHELLERLPVPPCKRVVDWAARMQAPVPAAQAWARWDRGDDMLWLAALACPEQAVRVARELLGLAIGAMPPAEHGLLSRVMTLLGARVLTPTQRASAACAAGYYYARSREPGARGPERTGGVPTASQLASAHRETAEIVRREIPWSVVEAGLLAGGGR